MRIYTCDVCQDLGRCCEVTTDQDDPAPSRCPYGGGCDWQPAYKGGPE
jgi:hypothetical protein